MSHAKQQQVNPHALHFCLCLTKSKGHRGFALPPPYSWVVVLVPWLAPGLLHVHVPKPTAGGAPCLPQALRPVIERIESMSPEERSHYRLKEGALGPVHLRAVERVYGDQGPNLVELLRKNPAVAAAIVLARLQQKDAEWRKVKEEMNRLWRKVFEQNYFKSLDHRSFYFKQADKKALASKAMMNEVQDAVSRRRQDERFLAALSTATPLERLLHPDLAYPYTEMYVPSPAACRGCCWQRQAVQLICCCLDNDPE